MLFRSTLLQLAFLGTMAWTGSGIGVGREVLIGFDLLLVVVAGLVLYAISARDPRKPPGLDSRPLPAWGFYARNVKDLRFENVRLSCVKDDLRHVMICDGADRLTLEGFRYPKVPGAAEPLVLDKVQDLRQ